MLSISLIFPMYNEEENAVRVIEVASLELSAITPDYEIIAVDDGSMDKTNLFLKDLAERKKNIRLVHHPKNRGLGASLRSGFAQASKELVVYSDADFPFDLKEITRALEYLQRKDADVFSAYRINRKADGFIRTAYSFVYNHLINLLFHLGVSDVNFSFKIFKREALQALLPELKSEGSFIDAEMLIAAKRKDFKIVQQAIRYFPRQKGKSTLSRPTVILKILKEMFAFSVNHRLSDLKKELLARYRNLNLFQRLHLYFRYKSCPFGAVERFVPKEGVILDFGCGHGLFTNYLAMTSSRRNIIGIDISEPKIKIARKVTDSSNITYAQNQLADIPNADFNAIAMVDILYLLPYALQEKLIRDCIRRLKPSGVLVVKEMSKHPTLKYFWNYFQETLAVKILKITEGNGFYFRTKEGFESLLGNLGLKVKVHDLSRGYFYPHILFVCTKG
ncbi:MAG: glycosyltransferase [Candidatus Omnitrophica bacterium]|nr:glycosyltransferase [Candidatus Omnitrophota bacterium]